MYKVLWQALLICPAVLASCWLIGQSAIAQAISVSKNPRPQGGGDFISGEWSVVSSQKMYIPQLETSGGKGIKPGIETTDNSQLTTDARSGETSPAPIPDQEDQNNVDSNDPMAQVTSVSQLKDVQPTDWAFQAVQSLVERYGCIAGYPDGTFRGNRALTRYEFAAGLNACLDRVNELIATTQDNRVTREDLATLERLRGEFAAELSTLRGRVDALEINTAKLQASQFSTTTKLNALAFINVTGATSSGGRVRVEGTPASLTGPLAFRGAGRNPFTGRPLSQTVDNPNITVSDLVWLNFNTSFTGKDSLVTQLAIGNGNSPANQLASAGQYNTFGVPFTDQTAGFNIGVNDVVVRELFYSFPVSSTLQIGVGPRLNWYRVFDNNRFTFILTGASSFNSSGSTLLNTVDRGSGVVALWKPSKQFQFNIGYLGENDDYLPGGLYQTSSDPNRGLFGGNYSATAELTFSPNSNINLRLLYNRSRLQQYNGQIGGAAGEPLYGLADDGASAIFDPATGQIANGGLKSSTADTFEANFDWLLTRGIGIFGRYTFGSTHLKPIGQNVNAQSIQAGVAFPDLGKEGALATISYLIPFSVLDGRRFLISNGGNGGVQFDVEANYYYPLSDNIAIVPAFYFIANANNFSDNPNIYVGNVRLQFSF